MKFTMSGVGSRVVTMLMIFFAVTIMIDDTMSFWFRIPIFLVVWLLGWFLYTKIVQEEVADGMILCEECRRMNKLSKEVEEKVDEFLK